MVKNLDVSKYRNGDNIPQVTDQTEWTNLTTGAWCYYENNTAYGPVHGKLYSWYAVNDSRGLAPSGWHIPSDTELTTLINCLGGDALSGGAMIEIGTTYWETPNAGATNSSGFTALPAGFRSSSTALGIGRFGYWWSASENTLNFAWSRAIGYDGANSVRRFANKSEGYSVRCVKD